MASLLLNHQRLTKGPTVTVELVSELSSGSLYDNSVPIERPGADEAFHRWRPRYHLMAVDGWMNDPSGLGYDPATKTYHVGFQWNSKGNDWGDICWGHASSKDLVSWTVSETPWLSPSTGYDHLGIFTGCMVQTDIGDEVNTNLTGFYTAVRQLPIHYTLKYKYGSEALGMITSRDAGLTWQKYTGNPVLPGPPSTLSVTGWRDPFVSSWPSLSAFLNEDNEKMLYGIISGGITAETPTTFLYQLSRANMAQWRYLGSLVNVGLNHFASRWSGDMGINWEVTNFVTLEDEYGQSINFLLMGSEGPKEENLAHARYCPPHKPGRRSRSQLWMAGSFRKGFDTVQMAYDFGGILDHGCYYAANSFWDPVERQRVVIGWVPEDDLPDDLRRIQDWSGAISLPRVLGIQTLRRVCRARSVALADITSFKAVPDGRGCDNMSTLSIRPYPKLDKLRVGARHASKAHVNLKSARATAGDAYFSLRTSQWEMQCRVAMDACCTRAGIRIGYSKDFGAYTDLYYDPTTASFVIERDHVNTMHPEMSMAPEVAPFTLFTQHNCETGDLVEETLDIRAYYDTSVLEVYVNDRVAITARVYTASSSCLGLTFYAEGGADSNERELAELVHCQVWDGLSNGRGL